MFCYNLRLLITIAAYFLLPVENEARARLGRESSSLYDDLQRLDNAVKSEVEAEAAQGFRITPDGVTDEVEAEFQDAPWWKRLTQFLGSTLWDFVKFDMLKIFEQHVVPAIRHGVDDHLIPVVRKQFVKQNQ